MYVCLCMGVSDREIKDAIDEGAYTVPEVTQRTGAGSCCGSCTPTIATLLDRDVEVVCVRMRRLKLIPTPTAA